MAKETENAPAPIRIVDLVDEFNLQVHWDKITAIFQSKTLEKLPVCIVTAIGPGKSFLLNYMLRFLKNGGGGGTKWMADGNPGGELNGFRWKPQEGSKKPPGIDIWPIGHVIQNNNSKDIAVFLLDLNFSTAGTDKLYEFALSICDTVVFVSESEIQEPEFDALFSNFRRFQDGSVPIARQAAFMIWESDPQPDTKYGPKIGQQMLEKFLGRRKKLFQKKGQKLGEAFEAMVQHFNFDEPACSLLPPICPRDGHEIFSQDFNGSYNQLSKEFVKNFRQFIANILEETLACKSLGYDKTDIFRRDVAPFLRHCEERLQKLGSSKLQSSIAEAPKKPEIPPILCRAKSLIDSFQSEPSLTETLKFPAPGISSVLFPGNPLTKSRVADPQALPASSSLANESRENAASVTNSVSETTKLTSTTATAPGPDQVNAKKPTTESSVTVVRAPEKEAQTECDLLHQDTEGNKEPYKNSEEVYNIAEELAKQFQQEWEWEHGINSKLSEPSDEDRKLQIAEYVDKFTQQLKARNLQFDEGNLKTFRTRLTNDQTKYNRKQTKQRNEQNTLKAQREKLNANIHDGVKKRLTKELEKVLGGPHFDKIENRKDAILLEPSVRQIYNKIPKNLLTNEEFFEKCYEVFDSVLKESKRDFQELSDLNLVKKAEAYKRQLLERLEKEDFGMESIRLDMKRLRKEAETFPNAQQRLLGVFPEFTKIKLHHEIGKVDAEVGRFIQLVKNVDKKFEDYICFTDEGFKSHVLPIVSQFPIFNLRLCPDAIIRRYEAQNQNVRQAELGTLAEAKQLLVEFYQEEMKAHVKKNDNSFKHNLETFHTGLVSVVMNSLNDSLGYREPPEFVMHQISAIQHEFSTHFEKYKTQNETNLDISRGKVANRLTARRAEYNSKMKEVMANRGPFEAKQLRYEHDRTRDEVKKLYQMDLKSLVENSETELAQLVMGLETDLAKHQKVNAEKLEKKREEDKQRRAVEAIEAEARRQKVNEEENRRAHNEHKKRREEEEKKREAEQSAMRSTTPKSPAMQRPFAGTKLNPTAPAFNSSTYASVAAGASATSCFCLAIEFGLQYVRAGFLDEKGELQLIPIELGKFDTRNTLGAMCETDKTVYVGLHEHHSDKPIIIGELLLDILEKSAESTRTIFPQGKAVELRVEEIIGAVLHKVRLAAEEHTSRSVDKACIAIPVWLNMELKQAVKIGARIAGFQQTKLISEFSAAAMNFKCSIPATEEKKLFVTTTSGHFHAALFHYREREVKMVRCGSTLNPKEPSYGFGTFLHSVTGHIFDKDEITKVLEKIMEKSRVEDVRVIADDLGIGKTISSTYPHCNIQIMDSRSVIKGAAIWVSKWDNDATKVKDIVFYKLLSQLGWSTRTICESNAILPQKAKDVHEEATADPTKEFVVHEVIGGKQRKAGTFSVPPSTVYNEDFGKVSFNYEISDEGLLAATTKIGKHNASAKWKGPNLKEEEVMVCAKKICDLCRADPGPQYS